jgi:DDE family transposase
VSKIGVSTHVRTLELVVIADLDTLLIALYVELTDRIIPSLGTPRRGPGRPPVLSDAELVCLAVAQVLLRCDDERRWLRAAPARVGHLFPRLLGQSEYNARLKDAAGLMEAALRWLAHRTPSSAELLRLMDGTPVRCGASRATAVRSDLAGWASYGHDASHHCFFWGAKLMLAATADGVITAFGLASPKLAGEREEALAMFGYPKNLPPAGTVIVADKGFAGRDFEAGLTTMGLHLVRPARKDEPSRVFPGWLRQRVEAIIWTLKGQLGLDRHGGRVPAGLWTRVVQRLLALNVAIWHNWVIGAAVKRSLIAYDH